MGEWYTTREPSEDAPGLQQRDCSRCDYSEVRCINMDGVVHGVDVALTISVSGGPANGSFYSPTDDKASINYFLVNNSDISINNLSINFVNQTGGAIGYCNEMASSGSTSGNAPYDLSPITSVEMRYVQAYAEFQDGLGNSYIVYSNMLGLPVGDELIDNNDELSSALYIELLEPELPSIGFFTEGSLVHLVGYATAVNGDVYSADIGCGLNYYSYIAESQTVPFSVDVIIYDTDCLNGYKDVRVFGCYYDVDGRYAFTYSNTIQFPCGIYGAEDGSELCLTLTDIGQPANTAQKAQQNIPAFYQEGETLQLLLTLTDLSTIDSGSTMEGSSAELFMSSPEFVQLTSSNGGAYISAEYSSYTVTAEDVERGYIDTVGFANVVGADFGACQLLSNHLMLPCGKEDSVLEAELVALSTPANGTYFVPGEQVWFALYVRNVGETTVNSISVTDAYMGELGWIASLTSGDVQIIDFVYTVTEADAENGSVIEHCKANGKEASAVSNMLYIPCGKGILEPNTDVVVSKHLPSYFSPVNGMYYTEGEYMEYYIYVMNCSDDTVYNISITDKFDSKYEATINMLSPGESTYVVYPYTVILNDVTYESYAASLIHQNNASDYYFQRDNTNDVNDAKVVSNIIRAVDIDAAENDDGADSVDLSDDGAAYVSNAPIDNTTGEDLDDADDGLVNSINTINDDHGWLMNTAAVTWMDADGAYHTSSSNVVAVPAGHGNSILNGDGDTMCRKTLIGETDGAYTYEQSFCTEHKAVMEQVAQIFAGCESFDDTDAAYKNIRQLWEDSLNALYEQWFAAVNDEYYVAAVKDKNTFFAMLEAYENALPARGIEDDLTINFVISEMLEIKCLELCYELHTEPEPDPASWMQEDIPAIEAFIGMRCSSVPDDYEGGSINWTDTYCESHNMLIDCALENVKASGNEKDSLIAWSFARTIVRAQLQKSYAEMAEELDADSAALIREDSAKLMEYLTGREELQKLYRSSDYTTLSELYVRGILGRLAINCIIQP